MFLRGMRNEAGRCAYAPLCRPYGPSQFHVSVLPHGCRYRKETAMTDIASTLAERGGRYGSFEGQARICQSIKRAFADSPNWTTLADDQRECLDMLANKIGRILNGDPDYHDSWHDIIGYTKLVADRLEP
jgi:hypothetical protein